MKSKLVFIITGVFICSALIMFLLGISMEFIAFTAGIVIVVIGIILFLEECRWRINSDAVTGKVAGYNEYYRSDDSTGLAMYTMEAEYTTIDGKLIKAKEQSGSSSKKFPYGVEITLRYSRTNPDLFIVEGDYSRIYAMVAVIAMGAAVMFVFGYSLYSGIEIFLD